MTGTPSILPVFVRQEPPLACKNEVMASGGPKKDKPPSTSFLGKVVGNKYRILDVLGQGGFGTVFLVEVIDGIVGEKLAMKAIHPRFTDDTAVHERFRNEIKVAMKIVHRYVVQIRDVGTTSDGLLYYTMDYCPGKTLRRLLREKGRLKCRRSYNIVRKVLRALSTAHALGIIHRDLKPANILVVKEEEKDAVRILDLGLATSLRSVQEIDKGLGSLHYMPPEQFRSKSGGGTIGRYSDLYSVGVILYECLTGKRPHEGETAQEVYNSIVTGHPRSIEELVPETKQYKGLEEVVLKSISPRPEDRYPSAREFCSALIEIFKPEQKPKEGAGWKRLFGSRGEG